MIDYKIIMILSLVFAAYLSFAFLDAKYKWQIVAWLNGETNSPFKNSTKTSTASWAPSANKEPSTLAEENCALEQELETLRERVQVLEKIVTEPAYELNKKLNQLDA